MFLSIMHTEIYASQCPYNKHMLDHKSEDFLLFIPIHSLVKVKPELIPSFALLHKL